VPTGTINGIGEIDLVGGMGGIDGVDALSKSEGPAR
jgi:hypothetical protein